MLKAKLDLDFVRSHFPQLENGWAFFENAGGSYVPSSVSERINRYLRELQIQPGGPWEQSQRAADMIVQSHQAMATLVNAQPEEVLIGPSTTMNVYVLANALASSFKPGDEIIVTNQDHEANGGAWRRLAERSVVIKEWCVNPETAELELNDLESLLSEKTRLVCFPHVSNIVGTINDVAKITEMVHQAGAKVCVDGVAYAAHRAIDVKAWDVDFYLLSIYKVYGPHLGLLYGKKALLQQADNQNHFFFADDAIPAKLNPGGQQHELAASLTGVTDYFESLYRHHLQDEQASNEKERLDQVFRLISEQEHTLCERMLAYLSESHQE